MPTIRFDGRTLACPEGANLRTVLLRARLPLYNGAARAIHCRGMGTCGTCAVRIDGPVSEPTSIEKLRSTKASGASTSKTDPMGSRSARIRPQETTCSSQ